jgi:hypothetical protein
LQRLTIILQIHTIARQPYQRHNHNTPIHPDGSSKPSESPKRQVNHQRELTIDLRADQSLKVTAPMEFSFEPGSNPKTQKIGVSTEAPPENAIK